MKIATQVDDYKEKGCIVVWANAAINNKVLRLMRIESARTTATKGKKTVVCGGALLSSCNMPVDASCFHALSWLRFKVRHQHHGCQQLPHTHNAHYFHILFNKM